MEKDVRFKGSPWYDKSKKEFIMIAGLGGIGSNLLYCLNKTVPATYYIIDRDKVENHNVGTQFYDTDSIGLHKSIASKTLSYKFNPDSKITVSSKDVTESEDVGKIVLCGFDNMTAREILFNKWKKREDRELFMDGRLRATYYEIFTVLRGQEDAYEAYLFDDKDLDEGECTFRQTAFFGMMIGARMTNILVNYLTNKYQQTDICEVPFKVTELGELLHLSTEHINNINTEKDADTKVHNGESEIHS